MGSILKWRLAQALEIRWWKQYLRKQSVESYLERKKAYWHSVLAECGLSKEGIHGKILDAGCGPAGIFTILDQQAIVAIDPLLEQYEKELDHFHQAWYPNVQFLNLPLENYQAPPQFDYIFCLNAINHVNDIELAMDRLLASAKPGATVVLSIDAHKYAALKWLFRAIPGDALHPHQYDLREYRTMLSQRGCRIQKEIISKPGRIFDYIIIKCEAAS